MAHLVKLLCTLALPPLAFADASAACHNPAVDRASVEHTEEEERNLARLSMLQVNRKALDAHSPISEFTQRGESRAAASPPTKELLAALPLSWTHVPKCGTSFVNSLMRLPLVCAGVPVDEDTVYGGDGVVEEFMMCPGYRHVPNRSFSPAHVNVGSYFDEVYDGHGVMMLRQPEQRFISHYNFLPASVYEFWPIADAAAEGKGCMVRMLTKDPIGWGHKDCLGVDEEYQKMGELNVSTDDVVEAKRRLRRYAFVGITEEWSLSVCLFHTMFGGTCHQAEFADVRLQRNSSAELYDTSVLEGNIDEFDGALYEEALSIFHENLRTYGVSDESCQTCFQSAGLV